MKEQVYFLSKAKKIKERGRDRFVWRDRWGNSIPCLILFVDGLGVPATNCINLVKVPKGREERVEFQSPFESVTCKTMRQYLHNNIRSSVYENKKSKEPQYNWVYLVTFLPLESKAQVNKLTNVNVYPTCFRKTF